MTDLMTIDRFTDNQDQFITDIIETQGANLPANIEDVIQVFEFSDFKAKAFKMMADKCKKLDEQSEIYHSALRSGQKWGVASIYSYSRMGEITRDMPTSNGVRKKTSVDGREVVFKKDLLKEAGINNNYMASESETIANNPEIRDRVIRKIEERGEIPTKTAVLNTIRVEKAKERDECKIVKNTEKKIKETPRAVKDYFNAVKDYTKALDFAIEVAKRDLFSEESLSIIQSKHDQIRIKMNNLEELV